MKSSFPKHHKWQSKNIIEFAMSLRSLYIVFWKRVLHEYVHIYIYIYVDICPWEKLFSKAHSLNLTMLLQTHFLEWRLSCFGKVFFIYMYMYLHKYNYIGPINRLGHSHKLFIILCGFLVTLVVIFAFCGEWRRIVSQAVILDSVY